jgi:two-component system, cell cycle sensor histidine kinase and response regulator CckA
VAAEQCLLNLAVNARDALGNEGGIITLSALPRQHTSGICAACRNPVNGDYVALICEDNGPGLPPDFLPRAFDAFTTTHARSGGSGLGLAITAELVHRAGGHILLRSNPVDGTCFTLLLEPA